jgi:hypothetical protein
MKNISTVNEVNIDDFYLKHRNTPCIIVGNGHTMMEFDYKNFKGIIILVGGAILRTRGIIKPNYLVTANNHFPIPEVETHLKIINKFKNLTWIISDTACYDSIWDKNEETYKKKIKVDYSFFDDRHFNNEVCKPKRKCCKFIENYPNRKMIYDFLAYKFKIKHKLTKQGVSVADFGIAYAILFGCNPIFIQGIDIPFYKYNSIYGKYYGSTTKKASDFEQNFFRAIRKKFFFYYLKNFNILPYFKSFYQKIKVRLFQKSIFYYEFNNTKRILLWLKKIANKRRVKIFVLSRESSLIKEGIFSYLSVNECETKYQKYF